VSQKAKPVFEVPCQFDFIDLDSERNQQILRLRAKRKEELKKESPTLFNLTYEQQQLLHDHATKVCVLDEFSKKKELSCICLSFKHRPASEPNKLIKCSVCHTLQHKECMSLNAEKMKSYICAHCQMVLVDPLQIPVKTILEPFRVH